MTSLELSLNEVAGLTGKKGGKEGIIRPFLLQGCAYFLRAGTTHFENKQRAGCTTYSLRRTDMGSVRIARRAGVWIARNVTTATASTASISVNGSAALTR